MYQYLTLTRLLSFFTALYLAAGVGMSQAAEVRMAFGDRIPPFCFPETQSGIELEVIGEALAYRGHVLKPVFLPFARIPLAFQGPTLDGAMTDVGVDMRPFGAVYGDTAVVYDNVFITLTERGLKIRTPADLEGLRIISFQGAAKRYPQWLEGALRERRYFEQNDQAIQVRTLDLGRYDVVLSDRTIYRYFAREHQRQTGKPLKATTEHAFTRVNPDDYRPVFKSQEIRDDFNAGLKHLRSSGRYQAIYDKYMLR